jgi:hypothetical protein
MAAGDFNALEVMIAEVISSPTELGIDHGTRIHHGTRITRITWIKGRG